MRSHTILGSKLTIILTSIICVILILGGYVFSKITSDLVITPVEDMIMKIQEITKDPLKAAQEEEEKFLYQELDEKDDFKNETKNFEDEKLKIKKDGDTPMETQVLESQLTKIGALLALGFGEAGASIIAKNMQVA